MKVWHGIEEARQAEIGPSVVTLGVFDGVHVGHRHVIRDCMTTAIENSMASVVVTFSEHPQALIAGRAPKLITSLEHRLRLFQELGVGHCLALQFDAALRAKTATEFAHEIFEEALSAQLVVLGHNCHFGHEKVGDAAFLISHADEFSFQTRRAEEVRLGQSILSSTAIRKAIETGELTRASHMLGRPFSLFGTVIEGDKRGRGIGFPTANMDLHHELLPPCGVYGCRVQRADGSRHLALVNVGKRPTFHLNQETPLVEAHLLDFEGDLYGEALEIVFLFHLRDEMKFDGVSALKAQIVADRVSFLERLKKPRFAD